MSMRPAFRRIAKSSSSSQTFQLPDGRVLGFAEYGMPNGKPLLFFHGYPSSRLEAEPADDIARRCGIRLLSLDRPGFGLSTAQPGRRIVDWPNDVHAFAKGMGLDRFVIMGGSGGGPFALACAHALPRHMVAGVGLFASAGPWEAGAHHMSLVRRMISTLAVYWPSGLGVLLSTSVRGLRAIATSGPIVRRIDAWLEAQDKKEKENEDAAASEEKSSATKLTKTKTLEERRNYLLRLLIDEPFAQSVDATVLEARLLSSQDWGFKFEDVDFDPVRIWHGAKDGNSPIAVIRYLAQRLPHGVLREYENDTHYTMFPHLEEALMELAGDHDTHPSKAMPSSST
ncbi:conserved hypothetical protein [Talaromyces stipitatus ATCC 10500]|uniref:AB hydrolase-1 domain-containing protein n=1 Tax=Talaromyces stipitatus (strain ATCC 10500 / CBS 375.48 / QM 6759 / NRRL 1006) TaxID=441959 RepID=B8ML79_TALSN|nr:uncharacterized protein TSTA_044600 [Talaromyces stipitatus ATCC 10500]EED14994.1 conserved hypothetical protein [Talaromyces stipitatus ATCC 10500]